MSEKIAEWVKELNSTPIDELKLGRRKYTVEDLEKERASVPKGCIVVDREDVVRALRSANNYKGLAVVDVEDFINKLFTKRNK